MQNEFLIFCEKNMTISKFIAAGGNHYNLYRLSDPLETFTSHLRLKNAIVSQDFRNTTYKGKFYRLRLNALKSFAF